MFAFKSHMDEWSPQSECNPGRQSVFEKHSHSFWASLNANLSVPSHPHTHIGVGGEQRDGGRERETEAEREREGLREKESFSSETVTESQTHWH